MATLPPMKGVVAAGHRVTAEAGAQVLREGGNAFDAAVCAVLASFASESLLTGLGAGGFMLAHTADGEDHLLDFFVEAGGRGLDPRDARELVGRRGALRRDVRSCSTSARPRAASPARPAGLWEVGERLLLDAVRRARRRPLSR